MSELIDLKSYPVSVVLKELLKDKTTKKNIIFGLSAARSYRNLLIHVIGLDMNLRLFLPEERQRIVAPVGGLREVENNG